MLNINDVTAIAITVLNGSVWVLLEGLVDGPEPAHIGAGSEQNEPQDGHAKVGCSASTTHPCQAANEIHGQCGTVHYGGRKPKDKLIKCA